MQKIELKVFEGVVSLAVTLVDSNRTMSTEKLTKWINTSYQGFQHPYGVRGVILAAFRRAHANHDQDGKNALISAFTNVNGSPAIWNE